MNPSEFASGLLGWYDQHKRDLPWRDIRDPYKIWLSEVILQQTRVQQGLPYYLRFVEKYPTVSDLAEASEEEVLRLWQGLGYYSRARNMHAAARTITTELNGRFPDNFAEIRKLKGVGDYTAAAVASFAFNEKVAVVDGNVYRVLARVFGVEDDIASPAGKRVFAELARELLPATRTDAYNQAIMEFGALHCKPANPDCMFCHFAHTCQARLTSRQQVLPVKSRKVKIKKRYFHYIVVNQKNKFLMKKRLKGDVWEGLYDFPLLEDEKFINKGVFLHAMAEKTGALQAELRLLNVSAEVRHVLTHQRLHVRFYQIETLSESATQAIQRFFGAKWQNLAEMEQLPKPVLMHNYLSAGIF